MQDETKTLIEAALFVSGRTIKLDELARICNSGSIGMVRRAMEDLQQEYSSRGSAMEIIESKDGYEMKIRREIEAQVLHLAPETDMPPAVLKTLALIAYSQPIKQAEVIKERGNGAYKYIRKLREQELIEAHRSGRTKMLTTTPKFKQYFQIQDLRELVKIKPSDDSGQYRLHHYTEKTEA